jgi:hypothetical protein
MSTLYPNKYNNPTRTVVGTVNTTSDDMVLLCDTTSAAVIINLLDIPQNKWNAVWKLYVIDSSNNAVTNSITINAPSGFTINGSTSVVINVNGGICVVSIASNTAYLGSLNYSTGGGGGTVAASNTTTTVVADCNDFKFDSTYFNVTNPSGSVAGITNADSGWLDLLGFEFIPVGFRPQYRILGKMIVFRGNAVVPLASNIAGSTLIPMTVTAPGGYYVNDPYAYTFTGASPSNGCSAISDGAVIFNRQQNVFQTPIQLDNTYTSGIKICTRVVKTFDAGTGVNLATPFSVFISPNPITPTISRLIVSTYRDAESNPFIPDNPIFFYSVGLGTLRPIVANVKAGQFAPDYRSMRTEYVFTVTSPATADAIQGATYTTLNGSTFTVLESINGGTTLICVGNGLPNPAPNTLTLSSIASTGDATIAYSSFLQRNSATHSSLTNQNLNVDYSISTATNTFLFDVDSTDENLIGGFIIPLDGLTAFTV